MKAREIIAGWPRGTSTSKPWAKYPAWWVPYLRSWSQVDRIKLLSEQAMEKEYRDGQDRMMDEWRTKTGRFSPPKSTDFEIAGFSPNPPSIYSRHYYEPLEDHTWPTYGGITREGVTMVNPNYTPSFNGDITVRMLQDELARSLGAPPEDPQITLWRKRILEGWEKYGVSGQPLDPRTVEHLAHEFAKPLEWPKVELKLKEDY